MKITVGLVYEEPERLRDIARNDPGRIFGLGPDATLEELKKRHDALIRLYNSDHGKVDEEALGVPEGTHAQILNSARDYMKDLIAQRAQESVGAGTSSSHGRSSDWMAQDTAAAATPPNLAEIRNATQAYERFSDEVSRPDFFERNLNPRRLKGQLVRKARKYL